MIMTDLRVDVNTENLKKKFFSLFRLDAALPMMYCFCMDRQNEKISRLAVEAAIVAAGGRQRHLAQALGCDPGMVHRWLRGAKIPLNEAIKINKLYGISLQRLAGMSDDLDSG